MIGDAVLGKLNRKHSTGFTEKIQCKKNPLASLKTWVDRLEVRLNKGYSISDADRYIYKCTLLLYLIIKQSINQ